jgi:hypothetical protein
MDHSSSTLTILVKELNDFQPLRFIKFASHRISQQQLSRQPLQLQQLLLSVTKALRQPKYELIAQLLSALA